MTLQGTLGLLGFGNMGAAIAAGLVHSGTVRAAQVAVFDVDNAKCAAAAALGAVVAVSPSALARASNVLILAVKPQTMDEALAQLKPGFAADKLAISIAAGVSIAYIQQRLGPDARVARVMPNTPALVGAGAAAIALSDTCSEADGNVARAIFDAVGISAMVAESDIDAVTALSGSGPAYFFYVVECLVRAAAAQGLSEEHAARLAAQTLLGAGRLLSESGESAAVLRERVTSKGGTTAAALKVFQEQGLERVLAAGVAAAAARSRELGK